MNMLRVCTDVALFDFKDHLNQINVHLNHGDTRMMNNVEYCRPLINSNERIRLTTSAKVT